MESTRNIFKLFVIHVSLICIFMHNVLGFDGSWQQCHATFYGGSDASGTMGGACGYGNLYTYGYGTNTVALSTALWGDGASCGQCFSIVCDYDNDSQWCLPYRSITVTATNLCPPNWDYPSDDGGWCNPPRCHFDMAQPAFEQIANPTAGIVPVWYQRVSCAKQGNIRFTINGCDYFNLVTVWNVGGPGSIAAIWVQGPSTGLIECSRNWGSNWQSNAYLTGKAISFLILSTDWQSIYLPSAISDGWIFGQTYEGSSNFY